MARYKTTVASFATSINNNDEDITLNTIGAVCYKQEYPINRSLLQSLYNGLAIKMRKVYQYGRDHYTYGLPNGYTIYTDINEADVKAAVEADVGMEVDIYINFLGEPEPIMFARDHAQKNWQWRQEDDWLARSPLVSGFDDITPPPPGAPLPPGFYDMYYKSFLHDADLRPKTSQLDVDIRYGNEYIDTPNAGTVYYPKIKTLTIDPDVPMDPTKLYYHVRWAPKGNTEIDHQYWFYELGSGGHPELDIEIEGEATSPFLPIIPVKEDKKNMGPEVKDGEYVRDENGDLIKPDTDLYRTSVQLCKYAGVDFDETCKEIYSNPDAKDIEHAYITFSIELRPERETAKVYLYQFFEDLALRSSDSNYIEIKDAKYNIRISYDSCTKVSYAGVLDEKIEIDYTDTDIVLRYQDTATHYGEITVTNLLHTNYIFEGYAVQTDVEQSGEEDNYNFQVPLRYDLSLAKRSAFEREELYRESLKIIFNDYERRKLKWYETGFFKFVMVVIAVVLAYFSSGTSLAWLAAAYSAYGIVGAVLYVAAMVAISKLISYGFAFLADELGAEWAIAVGIVAAIAGTMLGDSNSLGGMLDAQNLLALSSALISGATTSIQQGLQELNDDMNDFREYAEELSEELEELQKEFEYDGWVDPYDFIGISTVFIPHETPEDFYNRTIHAGNIGVASLSQVETYVDNKLELPKLNFNAENMTDG